MRSLRMLPLAALAACATADAREGLVTIDTLPGGIPSVTTAEPVERGRWSLVHERDVQPGEGEPGELLEPQDLALRDDGTLIVAETGPVVVNVYDPTGAFVRAIGRDGSGPGEFRAAFVAVRGDTLVVQDPQNTRATSFDLRDGSVIAERLTVCCYWAPLSIDAQGRAVAHMMTPPDSTRGPAQGFIRFPIGGTTAESLVVLERAVENDDAHWRLGDGTRMVMMMTVPMQPQSQHAYHPGGAFVTGWGGEYRLRLTSDGADTLRVFGRPWTAAPVTAEQRQALVEQSVQRLLDNRMGLSEETIRKSLDPAAIPDTRPAWERVAVDGAGRIWVRASVDDTSAVHLDLFDAEGIWLDQVTVPEAKWATTSYVPTAFSRDHLALLLEDDDGLPVVRIYRIERRGE